MDIKINTTETRVHDITLWSLDDTELREFCDAIGSMEWSKQWSEAYIALNKRCEQYGF